MKPGLLVSVVTWVALVGLAATGCGDRQDVPVYRVERQDFVHKVTADGVLKAGRTTQLTVPLQVVATVRLAWLAPEGARVAEGDVVARFDAKAMQDKLADAQIDRGQSDRRIDQSKVSKGRRIGELHADADIADLELEHARNYQKTDSLVFSRRELMEDAVDERLAAERKQHAEANAVTEESLAATELALLEIERRKATDEIGEAEQGLDALEVRAPHAGLLTYVRNWRGEPPTVGSEMFRGQPLLEIPDLDSLEASVYVLEADAGGLAEGQTAEVVIEAHPNLVLAGVVQRVDPVSKPRFRGSPVQYFGAVVSFVGEGDERRILDAMKPGQRVRTTVYLQNVESALVVPRQAVHEEDGVSRVWRRRGGAFERVAVTVGASGLGQVVVSEGLAEGDVIALQPPNGVRAVTAPAAVEAAEAQAETMADSRVEAP